MKKNFIALLLLFSSTSLFAQTIHFKEIFQAPGRDEPIGIINAAGGGYYLYGYTKSSNFGLYDLYIIRANADGEKVWWKNYGTYKDEAASPTYTVWGVLGFTLLQEDNGGLIASFSYRDTLVSSPEQTAVLKLDSSGTILSQHPYTFSGYSASSKMIKNRFAPNEYFLLVDDYGGNDMPVIAKINSSGDVIAAYNPPNGLWKHPVSFAQTADKGFIISGTQEYNADYCWLIKIDSAGNRQWAVNADSGYISQSYGSTVMETAGGNYIWTMYWAYGNDGEALIKLDHNGNKIWAKSITALNTDTISSGSFYEIAADKYAVLCTKKFPGVNQYKTVIAVIDTSGNIDSGKLFDFGNNNRINHLSFPNNNEMAFGGNWNPGVSSDILYGTTNINTSNECFESTYNLQTVDRAIGVYMDNQFLTGSPISYTTGTPDALMVSDGWSDTVVCVTLLAIENSEDNLPEFKIYPNPASNQLTIESKQLSVNKITISDNLGREIFHSTNNLRSQIVNLNSFADGIYFIQLQSENTIVVRKLIVQH